MTYTFSHVFNSKNIRRLTPQTLFSYKPRYCYYSKKGAYYPAIATVNKLSNTIVIQHESEYSNTSITRAEDLVRNWLKKHTPYFYDDIAYLIINNSPTDAINFVIDQNKNDPADIEYDLIELMTSTNKPTSLLMVCTDLDYPEIYYNYTTSVDVEALLIFDLFKDLSYTTGINSSKRGTEFMVEYIIEFYGLKPITPGGQLFLSELKNSDYVFPPHVTTEAVQNLYLDITMIDEYYLGTATVINDNPTLSDILFIDGLLNVRDRYEVVNDTDLEHFDLVVASPNILYIYTLVEDPKKLLEVLGNINDAMINTQLGVNDYTVVHIDTKESLESLRRAVVKNVSVQ